MSNQSLSMLVCLINLFLTDTGERSYRSPYLQETHHS
uniref:Uncharacterized protein n=1 Tax=Arundo donax TaxID=35708 RepID=A0A0A9HNK5_ARUDO